MTENAEVSDVQYSDTSNYISGYENDIWKDDFEIEDSENDNESIESLKLQIKFQSIFYELATKILEKIIDL